MSLDVAALERSVVAAVAPPRVLEVDGWLVPLDDGAIGRAKSAVPLSHDLDPRSVDRVVEAFRDHRLPPAFRLADTPALDPIREAAARHGVAGRQPTVMKLGEAARIAALGDAPARLLERPDDAWSAVFLGDGFDPAEGALRIRNLSRAPSARYGAAGADGATRAVGVLTVFEGWGGVHGMRTAPEARGRGHAAAILGAFGRALASEGIGRVVLQVEEANPARRLYRRAGFQPLWTYRYWR
ncbi:MAG: GNAT family N-acetyltransferase [Phenylobacterium sp.]|uniref:GNAT family N-acetyltransferase n=1 Tax=Phenylobacterium sp. TaxID=1871053 RepID=UPI001A52BD2D|nr:GNAT family N-acetyltransferase [Phenylobacterium sp.]MBL8769897.1 GNAT family N-acetyltransferase [Phenylobacterium sp.]